MQNSLFSKEGHKNMWKSRDVYMIQGSGFQHLPSPPQWYRRLGGKKRQLSPIGKSVSVSFRRVRVVRACVRAKLCERGREVLLNAGGSNGKKYDSGVDFSFCVFAVIRMGFKEKNLQKLRKAVGFLNILLYSLLFAWVLRKKFCRS